MREPRMASCTHAETTRSLIIGELSGPEKQAAQQHLERCEACRTRFHDATADRLPHVPSYTFLEHIGRGGFGHVYKAVHHTTTRADAVKVLSRISSRRVGYFANEVHLVARLRHPNIVTLYEAHLDANPPFYSMELIEGHHLGAYLERHELTVEQRVEIVATVANALDYAHQQGVIHRDVKPQNVLMDHDGQPRVVDFGVAKWAESEATDAEVSNETEGVVGTRGFIAPEIYAHGKTDARTDIYSLGALLHVVLLGDFPPLDRSADALLPRLRAAEVERPADLAAILATCLAEDPNDRYASAGELAKDLKRYGRGEAVLARRDATWAYRAARVTALVFTQSPGLVIGLIAILATAGLSAIYELGELRQSIPGTAGPPAALVGFVPSTLSAVTTGDLGPGLEEVTIFNRKSWRRLYGAVMQRLAEVNPRVVMWDYYFPDCHPEHDLALIAGVEALAAPVVFAVRSVEPDGTPEMCPALENAITSYGSAMMTWNQPPGWGEMEVVVGMQRGFNEWVPSLSVATFAASRHPDASAHLHEQDETLQIRYRQRSIADGRYPWLNDYDLITLSGEVRVSDQHIQAASGTDAEGALQVQDHYRITRIDAGSARLDPNTIIPMEQVLTADREQLAAWFDDRVVIAGQLLPGVDQYRFADGGTVHGVEVHAAATQALLRRSSVVAEQPAAIRFRVAAFSFLAALVTAFLPLAQRLRIRVWSVIAGTGLCVGIGLAWAATLQALSPGWIDAVVAASTLLIVCGPVLLVRALQRRRLGHAAVTTQTSLDSESRTLMLDSRHQTSSSATARQ